jgi:GT2 family glycosyltransferase
MKPPAADRSLRVTVVMPVFNGRPYFRSALASAAAQTYPDLEILVVDDGSADPIEVADDVAAVACSKIRLLRKSNGGVGSALNQAIEHATGQFFAWLSHDDLYHPDKIARQIEYHRRIGDPDGSLFSNFDLIDDAGSLVGRTRFTRAGLMNAPRSALLGSFINGCTVLVPMHVMRKVGPFDETLRYTQDYDLWHRILKMHDFYLQEDRLVRYRIHATQGTHNPAATEEGDRLWIRMFDELGLVEQALIGGSRLGFERRMATRMAETPYARAAADAQARAGRSIDGTVVTAVLWMDEADGSLLSVLARMAEQRHPPGELVVACRSDRGVLDNRCAAPFGIPVKTVIDPDPNRAMALAIDSARGEYLAFLDPNSRSSSERFRYQVSWMQERATSMSFAPRPLPAGGSPAAVGSGIVVPMVTAMVHRSVFAAGHRLPPFAPGWSWEGARLAQAVEASRIGRALVSSSVTPQAGS